MSQQIISVSLPFRFMLIPLTLASVLVMGLVPPAAIAQQYVPPNRGLPGRREGGGTRGGCLQQRPSLTALMPSSNFAQTVSPYPSFFWYVPQSNAKAAEFILLNAQEQEVYRATFQITGEAGVVRLTLPEQANLPPLEMGQDYHWYFALICDLQDRSGDILTEGWVQRVELDPQLMQQLVNTTGRDRASLYATAGLWQDALMALADLRQSQPSSLSASLGWRRLLDSVGLRTVADAPLVEPVDPGK